MNFLFLVKAHAGLEPGAVYWWQRYYSGEIHRDHTYLLAGVYQRLEAENYQGPEMAVLQRVYLATWTRYLQQTRLAAQALKLLRDGGVEALLLKGMAVSCLLDWSAHRTMDDFDLLIRPQDLERSAELLNQNGWTSDAPLPTPARRGITHGQSWQIQGHSLDLHWFIMPESLNPCLDEDCRDRAQPISLQEESYRALDPTDLLLHTLVHGCKAGSRQAWIVDGYGLILHSSIDWNRILDQAQRRRAVLQCRTGLEFLAQELQAPVPDFVRRALQDLPIGLSDRLYFLVKTRRRRLWWLLLWPWLDYLRLPVAERKGGFAHYLTRRWNLQGGLCQEALRRLKIFLTAAH